MNRAVFNPVPQEKLMKTPSLAFVRDVVRLGLFGAATRLQVLNPDLATQFLDINYTHADFQDKFLVSCWGTLSARMRLLLTEETVCCFSGVDFTASIALLYRLWNF